MKIKLIYVKWLKNNPVVAEFEGTMKEFKELSKQGFCKVKFKGKNK